MADFFDSPEKAATESGYGRDYDSPSAVRSSVYAHSPTRRRDISTEIPHFITDELNGEPEEEKVGDETDVEMLMRHWMNERCAPEILENQLELMVRIITRLETQAKAVAHLSGVHDSPPEEHLQVLLVQTDIERVKWLAKAYTRCRTYKIEKYAQFILQDPRTNSHLTELEVGFASRCRVLEEKYLKVSVLDDLPERMHRLDEEGMVVEPDLDQAVFAQARRRCPQITLPDGNTLIMEKGATHMVRYRTIQHLLEAGLVKLV